MATRKLGLPAEIAQQKVEILATMNVIVVDVEHLVDAIKLHRLYGLSFWDCLILHCAKAVGYPDCCQKTCRTADRSKVLPSRTHSPSSPWTRSPRRPSGELWPVCCVVARSNTSSIPRFAPAVCNPFQSLRMEALLVSWSGRRKKRHSEQRRVTM